MIILVMIIIGKCFNIAPPSIGTYMYTYNYYNEVEYFSKSTHVWMEGHRLMHVVILLCVLPIEKNLK